MKRLLPLLTLLLIACCTYAQNVKALQFANITDTSIRRDLAYFTHTGRQSAADTGYNRRLTVIPIRRCDDTSVYFNLKSSYWHLDLKGKGNERMLYGIKLVNHSHYLVKIPLAAYANIPQSNTCHFTNSPKQRNAYTSPYFKAFRGASGLSYLYMLGGTPDNKIEVTWVIKGDYLFHVIDELP